MGAKILSELCFIQTSSLAIIPQYTYLDRQNSFFRLMMAGISSSLNMVILSLSGLNLLSSECLPAELVLWEFAVIVAFHLPALTQNISAKVAKVKAAVPVV